MQSNHPKLVICHSPINILQTKEHHEKGTQKTFGLCCTLNDIPEPPPRYRDN